MDDDKKNRCYICGKDRGIVIFFLIFSWKRTIKSLKSIFLRNTSYGITSTMHIVLKTSMKQTEVD